MSESTNGPRGAYCFSVTLASIFSIERPCSYWARQSSPTAEFRIRLTTNPGTSPQVIGCLRIAWAKLEAACRVSSEVSSPATI
jgi:hypothetical protein